MADMRRLGYFLSVVDCGTITGAAHHLRIAQPALSRHMKVLEAQTGLKLFRRNGNRLVLTPSGSALVSIARRLIAEERNTDQSIERLRTGIVDRLVCGATESTIRGFIAPFIAHLDNDAPIITTLSGRHLELTALLNESVDFLVLPYSPGPEFVTRRLGTIHLRAHVSDRHPWILDDRVSVSLPELAQEQLILPRRQSTTRELIEHAVFSRFPPRVTPIECDDHVTILALTAAGRGVAVSPEPELFGTRQLEISLPADEEPALGFSLFASWLPGHYAGSLIDELCVQLQLQLHTGR